MVYGPINVINTALAVTLHTTNKQIERSKIDNFISKGESLQNKRFSDRLFMNSLWWAGDSKYAGITLSEKEFSKNIKKGWTKENTDEFNIITNLLFYMNAFPDYVYEGVPKRAILDSKIFHKKRITLTSNTKFFERLEKMPHLRRGHFRTYSSDYFINMKGQTEWIEPTFVKGKSITVKDGISM